MTVHYEFTVETLDFYDGCGDNPDIVDTMAFDTLQEAAGYARTLDAPWCIALVRSAGNDLDGLKDRHWAYPQPNGKLPARFEDGPAVPAKFLTLAFPVR